MVRCVNEFTAVLESERDLWRTQCSEATRRATVLDANLEALAKDHRRLEMAAASVRETGKDDLGDQAGYVVFSAAAPHAPGTDACVAG